MIDRSVVGTEYHSTVWPPVTPEEIREFAAACGETDPRYFGPEPVAPPTFCLRFRSELLFHPGLPRDLLVTGFDAGKDIVFGVPIRAGDTIRTHSVVDDVYEKTGRSGTMTFIVSRQTLTNQRGETVALIHSRFVVRPPVPG
jgi:acyl dehydratase